MNFQKVNIKLYAENEQPPALEDFIPVFHNWIQNKAVEELLIDVADYRHVPGGPGVLLMGHEANYSVAFGPEERFGLTYQTKRFTGKSNTEIIRLAFAQAVKGANRLQNDERLPALSFSPREMILTMNSRNEFRNHKAEFEALLPVLQSVLRELLQSPDFLISQIAGNSRERLTVKIEILSLDGFSGVFN